MALKFDRLTFKSGVMIINETRDTGVKTEDGKPVIEVKHLKLKPSDKGKFFEFWNEDDILKRYPHSFTKEGK
jgi:hypothetical protein